MLTPTIEEEILKEEHDQRLFYAIDHALNSLSRRERRTLELRFGFCVKSGPLTRAATARILGISLGKIRFAEETGLRRLHNKKLNLKEFLER